MYVQKYWLKEMRQFITTKKAFEEHIRECFDENYWAIFQEIKNLPGAISAEMFAKQAVIVKENCSEQAYQNLIRYGRRWGAV